MKKLIALMLALLMLVGMVACGAKEPAEEPAADTPATDAPATDAPATDAPAEEPADEPAEEPAEEREHVTLKFFARCNEQPDQDTVFAAFNEYCEEKLNTTVEWNFLGGTFSDKVAVMINSGEPYDAVWTSNWQNDYATNVARGAYVDITDMLADYPELYASMPEGFWEATKIGGRIYAVPCQQIAARTPAMTTVKEYVDAMGWTREDLAACHDYLDFEEYIQFAYDNYGAKAIPLEEASMDLYCGYEFLNGQTSAVAIKNDDPTCTVVNFYATPEFKAMCDEMAYLYGKGLLEPMTFNDVDFKRAELVAGRVSVYGGGTFKPGGEIEDGNTYGLPIYQTPHDTPLMTTGGIIATMWSISTTSEHPDRALEVLAMLSTDAYPMQLISWGIEGTHYTVNDEGCMVLAENTGFNPSQSWAMGNVFLTLPLDGQPVDVWPETAEVNASAMVSNLIGFNPDISSVEAEVTNVTNTFEQYKMVASGSLPVEETIAEFNEKLVAAGIDTLIAEMQAQVDAFLASK